MQRRFPAAGRGSRAPALPKAPSLTHRNSESLPGLDERLQTSRGGSSGMKWHVNDSAGGAKSKG